MNDGIVDGLEARVVVVAVGAVTRLLVTALGAEARAELGMAMRSWQNGATDTRRPLCGTRAESPLQGMTS